MYSGQHSEGSVEWNADNFEGYGRLALYLFIGLHGWARLRFADDT